MDFVFLTFWFDRPLLTRDWKSESVTDQPTDQPTNQPTNQLTWVGARDTCVSKNSFFPVLIYWSDIEIHLGFKNSGLSPPPTPMLSLSVLLQKNSLQESTFIQVNKEPFLWNIPHNCISWAHMSELGFVFSAKLHPFFAALSNSSSWWLNWGNYAAQIEKLNILQPVPAFKLKVQYCNELWHNLVLNVTSCNFRHHIVHRRSGPQTPTEWKSESNTDIQRTNRGKC